MGYKQQNREVAVAGFQLTGRVSRRQALTTSYTDSANRCTFDAKAVRHGGALIRPCYLELYNESSTDAAYFIVNSARATVGKAASAVLKSVTFTALDVSTGSTGNLIGMRVVAYGNNSSHWVVTGSGTQAFNEILSSTYVAQTVGVAGNKYYIACEISASATAASVDTVIDSTGTVTITFYSEVGSAGSVLSTRADMVAAINADPVASLFVRAWTASTADVATTGATALTGGTDYTGGSTLITMHCSTDTAGTILSTSQDLKAQVNADAVASGLVLGTTTSSAALTSTTVTMLANGYDKDSASARKAAVSTTATGTTGYREYLPPQGYRAIDEGSEDGIVDVVFLPTTTGVNVHCTAAYPSEG